MPKVTVEKINECFMKVNCDDGLARDLYDYFSFSVPNAKFMPSVKNRYWDGKVRLFSNINVQIILRAYIPAYTLVGINT